MVSGAWDCADTKFASAISASAKKNSFFIFLLLVFLILFFNIVIASEAKQSLDIKRDRDCFKAFSLSQ
jgi:hypothetical protein